jgi:hypothetical protein
VIKLPKFVRVALIPVGLVSVYISTSTYLFPIWLQQKIPALISEDTPFNATLGHVNFNPLALQLELHQFALTQNQSPVFEFESFTVQIDFLESVSTRSLVVENIELLKPFLPFNPIKEKEQTNDKPFSVDNIAASPIPFLIKHFTLSGGHITAKNGQIDLTPINISLTHVSSKNDTPALFRLSATNKQAGEFISEGEFYLTPLRSTGKITLSNLPLSTLLPFCSEKGTLTFSGIANLAMNFRVAIHEKSAAFFIEDAHLVLDNIVYQDKNRPLNHAVLEHFDLDNGQYDSTQQTIQFKTAILNHPRYTQNQMQLSLENLTLSHFAFNINSMQLRTDNVSWQNAELFDTKQNTLLFKLPEATFNKLFIDFNKQVLSIASLQASNADFRAWLNSQGELNYQTLLPEDDAQVNSEKQNDNTTSDAFWGVKIDSIDFTNFSATFEDKSLSKPLSISIKPISLKATNINTDKGSILPFELNTGVNSGGSVHIKGNAALNPFSTQSEIEVTSIGLDKFQSYVDQFAHIDVIKGVFNLDGSLDVAQGEQGELAVKFKGNSGIARLITRDQVQNKDLIKWDNLSLKNIKADLLAQRFIASSLLLEKPYARIIIGKDKRLNFSDMLIESATTKQTENSDKKTAKTSSDFHFQLDKVRISNGASSFSDLSMILPFSAEIKGLEGGASGISSNHESTINVTLKGNAYDLAPVDIKGKIQPYIGDYNATLSFKGMPLPLVSAYMAEFFGYKVEKGKMSLGVNYNVKNGELTADNNLLIEQFELGEQIDNPHAIDAPFNLAITLLKDVNGIINLNVPITGSLNDPQFDLGGVIGDAVLNILTKTISSPFQSIANLLETDEDLSAVQFAPGQAELSEWQKPKLDSIAKVLKDRTVLKLEIKATAFQSQDWNVLREDVLTDRLKTLKAEEINRKENRKIRPEYVELDEADTQRLLAQEFKEKFPQFVKRSFFGSLELVQPELGDFYSVAKETLLQSLPVEPKRLTKLAAARARSIAKYIVQTGGVPNERVFILDTAIDPPRQDNDIDALLFLKAD